jgi:HlyD family secretion protein
VAEAQVTLAEAQLAQLVAAPSEVEVAIAQTAVAQARAALAAAQIELERRVVRAPFSGTVGAVHIRPGEVASPGLPLLTLGDLSTLRVEVTDLDEIDVGLVAVGQQAVVTFDALPDRTFTGEVIRIAPMASPTGGGVNYPTLLVISDLDPQLRWGMTAFVDIAATR